MYNGTNRSQQLAVSEAIGWTNGIKEEGLLHWWFHQAQTAPEHYCISGERLLVLSPGERNDGPGPDILNCNILLDDMELAGAVEMHLRAGDWYNHGHHEDPAYDQVILHVVMNDQRGPDLPTLLVPQIQTDGPKCLANRVVTQSELFGLAANRFDSKSMHMQELSENEKGYSPYFLSLVEVILAGPQRDSLLHEVAAYLGLPYWPHHRKWMGSNQTQRRMGPKQQDQIGKLLKEDPLPTFNSEQIVNIQTWSEWDKVCRSLLKVRINRNQRREWLVNAVLPSFKSEGGLVVWQMLKPFRTYGHEKRYLPRLGLPQIDSILVQQAVLEWGNRFCKPQNCTTCPLIQSYHDLTAIN